MKTGFKIKKLRLISKVLKNHRLGDLLVSSGAITQQQLQAALAEQKDTNGKLGAILLKQRSISASQLYRKLALQYIYRTSAFALGLLVMVTTPCLSYAGTFEIARTETRNTRQDYPMLFGTAETKSRDINAFRKWTSVLERYEEQLGQMNNSPKAAEWKQMIEKAKGLSTEEKIATVNSFANKFRYIEDKDNYNMGDYWATPLEFLSKGGDCEDFAIAKYFALRALGFETDQLRIAIVKDKIKNLSHAVLIVYTEGQSYILDNQNKQVKNTLAVNRYQPIFSINNNAWWVHKA